MSRCVGSDSRQPWVQGLHQSPVEGPSRFSTAAVAVAVATATFAALLLTTTSAAPQQVSLSSTSMIGVRQPVTTALAARQPPAGAAAHAPPVPSAPIALTRPSGAAAAASSPEGAALAVQTAPVRASAAAGALLFAVFFVAAAAVRQVRRRVAPSEGVLTPLRPMDLGGMGPQDRQERGLSMLFARLQEAQQEAPAPSLNPFAFLETLGGLLGGSDPVCAAVLWGLGGVCSVLVLPTTQHLYDSPPPPPLRILEPELKSQLS